MYTDSQLVAIAIVPKFTSFLSMMGSTYIIYKVLSSPLRRSRPHHRLLAGMSIYDLIASTAYFLSTWPSPKGTPGVKFAMGNTATCTAQGFFSNFNLATALYNTCLSLYYLLIVRYRMTSKRIRTIERVMHSIPFIWSFFGGLLITADSSFNNAGQFCWVSQSPFGCEGNDCVRGKRAHIIQWCIFGILVICIIGSTTTMLLLCYTVWNQTRALTKKESKLNGSDPSSRKKKIQDIFTQASLYIGAFYLTWMFSIVNRVYFLNHGHLIFELFIFASTVHPLQGALNVLIYMRKELLASYRLSKQEVLSARQSMLVYPFRRSSSAPKSQQPVLDDNENIDSADHTDFTSPPELSSDSDKQVVSDDLMPSKDSEDLEDEIESLEEFDVNENMCDYDVWNPQSV